MRAKRAGQVAEQPNVVKAAAYRRAADALLEPLRASSSPAGEPEEEAPVASAESDEEQLPPAIEIGTEDGGLATTDALPPTLLGYGEDERGAQLG